MSFWQKFIYRFIVFVIIVVVMSVGIAIIGGCLEGLAALFRWLYS